MEYEKFPKNSGWLEKFKKLHCILAKVENKDANDNASENWKESTYRKNLKDYDRENFNADMSIGVLKY